jgi:glycosyltransferase involved in cell wall biosynthesis
MGSSPFIGSRNYFQEDNMIDELSIIIPTLNEEHYLPRLLESLAVQTFRGATEIIVVDGHSSDQTIDMARSFQGKLPDLRIIETEANVGHQRNVGANQAKYPYLLFIDADAIVPPGLIAGVAKRVDPDRPFVVAVMHMGARVTPLDWLFLGVGLGLTLLSRLVGAPAAIGDFLMTTKAQHEKIGGFVEGALLGEDTDYGFRSVKAGARYYFFWRLHLIASERRVRLMGRRKLLWTWARAFTHVVRHGPVFPGEGYEYPFGHYGKRPESGGKD